jgi:hypothetical protein
MIETRGRQLLNRRLRPHGPHSQQWLATVLHIGQPSVSLWARGYSRPEPHHRLALWLLWRIPQRTWLTAAEREIVDSVKAFVTKEPGPTAGALATGTDG